MAEVRKKEKQEKYNIEKVVGSKKSNEKKDKKKVSKSELKPEKHHKEEKKSLWVKFRIFCHGVKSEFNKVHWPDKEKMIKYSIATIIFIIFCSLFFYLINVIFALIQSLF